MGEVLKEIIAALERGGPEARECLLDASELLRKAWSQGFVPIFDYLQTEEMTQEDASNLTKALSAYAEKEKSPCDRRFALVSLARTGTPDLGDVLTRELLLTWEVYRSLSTDLFMLLIALDDMGEKPFPPEYRSRSPLDSEKNSRAAVEYLRRKGVIPSL